MGFYYFIRTNKISGFLLGLFLVLFLFQPFSALAIVYQPGETLNPACAPTDASCGVAAPITASSTSAFSLGGGTAPTGTLLYVAGTSTLQNIIPAGNLQYSIGSPESRLQNVYTNNLILGSASFVMEDVGGVLRFRDINSVIPGLVINPSVGAIINGNIFINGGAIFANATTTGSHHINTLVLGGKSFQNLVGIGLKVSSSTLALDNSGDWSGTFDGQEASYYLANAFSTSSANLWFGGKTTGDVTEGGNLYYTDTRARNALSVSAPLLYSTSTGAFSISQSSSAANGYLSSTDWNIFNNKQSATLNNGLLWVGNASNVATAVAFSGDATINNAGALTIANLAITNAKLAADSVTSEKILDGTIVTADIGADAVTTVKILDGNITTAKILDANVTLMKLSSNSVDSSKIVDGAIVSADISASAGIVNSQLASSTIGLTLGTNGTDVNVSGTPASLGGTLTLNIPDAGVTARGLITTVSQTFAGDKTFYGGLKTESTVGAIMTAGSDGAFAYNFGSGISNSLSKRVAQSSDDAEQNLATNSVNLTSSDLELINDNGIDQEVGIRFQNITIPQGATITNAYVEFTTNAVTTGTTNLNFYGESADNAATFTSATNNITGRAKTSSTVAWSAVPAWNTIGATNQTPNLAPIIQAIVNRAGWLSGNSLAIIVTGTSGSLRNAVSYNGNSSNAPLLVVQYTTNSTNVAYTINNLGPGLFRINDEFNDTSPFVVDSSGNVGIGTTTPSQILHVARSTDGVVARFTDANGDCDINPTTTALVCASDASLKKNVLTLDNSLEKVLALNPVIFDWNKEEDGAGNHIGFIAQDVEKLFPALVSTNEQGIKSIAYTNFAPILVKTIQEIVSLANGFKQSLALWFADTANGITDFFAKKIHTEQICLKKVDGNEYCVNGDDLEAILGGREEVIPAQMPADTTQSVAENNATINTEIIQNQEIETTVEASTSTPVSAEATAEAGSPESAPEPVQTSDESASAESVPAVSDSIVESNATLSIETAPTETAPEITSAPESLP